jgi:hypothetical protein
MNQTLNTLPGALAGATASERSRVLALFGIGSARDE